MLTRRKAKQILYFQHHGGQSNDSGESYLTTCDFQLYETPQDDLAIKTPQDARSYVNFDVEGSLIYKVYNHEGKLIELRFHTGWVQEKDLFYYDEENFEEVISSNMTEAEEIAKRNLKLTHIGTLLIPEAKSRLVITDVCLVCHEEKEVAKLIDWGKLIEKQNAVELPLPENLRDWTNAKLYQVDQLDAKGTQTAEYRLIF